MTKIDYEIDDFMSCCQSKGLSKKANTKCNNKQLYKEFKGILMKVNPFDKVKFLKSQRKKKAFIKDEEFYKLLKCLYTTKYAEFRDY